MHEVLLMDVFFNADKIPHNVSYGILTSIILIIAALLIRRSLRLVPEGFQNFFEVLIEAVLKLAEENIGHKWGRVFFPLLGTMFIFILLSNFMGLVPGFASATANVNTNAAMAVPVFFIYQFFGFKVHGIGYIKHFLGPIRSIAALPLMIIIFLVEVLSHLARPLTLTVRLFGNMTAKHLILGVLAIILPMVAPCFVLGIGIITCLVQALVFTLLSTLYLAGAIEEAH
jgi:F-type H+-transporting ATPase subunit a